MKTAPDVRRTIETLFERFPALYGFSVEDVSRLTHDRQAGRLEGELYIADLSVHPWRGHLSQDELLGEIAVALLELMDQSPEAAEQLRGRTFARSLH